MHQDTGQPITHNLLRNSQVRKKQSSSRVSQSSQSNRQKQRKQQNIPIQKYHFNYSQSQFPSHYERKSLAFSTSYHPQHAHYQKNTIRKQTIVVCNSLPKTKPKYSFTFGQAPKFNTQTKASMHQSSTFQMQNKKIKPRNIRKDMDLCIYTISDKLKEMKNIKSSNNQEQEGSSYRPSISQLRKNNKLFLDSSIHRIQPEIINNYIQTVYREYQIPDPFKENNLSTSGNLNTSMNLSNTINLNTSINPQIQNIQLQNILNAPSNQHSHRNHQNNNPSYMNIIKKINNTLSDQHQITLKTHENTMKAFNQQPDYSIQSNRNNRKSNLILQKQKRKDKKGKKRFLNMTLSKDKHLESKTFISPVKNKQVDNQHNQNKGLKQEDDISQRSKSKQLRQSNSQKKILQIKKNISSWKDNQNLYAERYSYLQSPYQIIQNRSHKAPLESNRGPQQVLETNRNINVHIRPFQQLMKVNVPSQSQYLNEKGNLSTINKNTTISQLMESKYHQSFFSQQGQIIEEFRYCVLCQIPILSANIYKHEEKCLGFINNQKLYTFNELYKMEREDQLKNLIKEKIRQIKNRTLSMIDKIRKSESQNQNYSKEVNENILSAVKNFVQSHKNQQDMNSSQLQKFNLSYKKVIKNYKNPYTLIIQESNKFHWFIKLLQNYQRRLFVINKSSKGQNQSTMQRKHNKSQSIVEDQVSKPQLVSEFFSQNIQ